MMTVLDQPISAYRHILRQFSLLESACVPSMKIKMPRMRNYSKKRENHVLEITQDSSILIAHQLLLSV
ncbi:hypothetical protein DB345_05175 [Spartobacteria bacterium LR76]|nr:hypothetical protein DB345_05175 [Spartobacteria bacterium LR76]